MIYQITAMFPKEEKYLLVDQLRRAAVSVCSNIAEGSSRISRSEKKRFYEISRSSLVEIDTQSDISVSLGYITPVELEQIEHLMVAVFKMLSKMISNLS
jgi:four helix bundle protein